MTGKGKKVVRSGTMTGKGKKVVRSDDSEPSSPPVSASKRRKVYEAGGSSSTVDANLKAKKEAFKKAKRIITTEEQAEGVKLKRRRRFNQQKDATCKRRGALKINQEEEPVKFPSLYTRTTPSSFYDALQQLNDDQKKAVHDIGFGSILSLQVKKLPCRLAYWILEKFDERRCELELDGGSRVKITEDDVYRVYGFPKGTETIPIFSRATNNALCEQWAAFFGFASCEKIKIGLVLREMLDCTTGGTWFKHHFMIAMAHTLIHSCTSGTVHPYILRCLENVGTLKRWNWAEYVLQTLIDNKISWVGDEDKVFAGPTLFLVLFYVDRCQMHRRKVKREFPILVNWSSADLRKRQATEENIKKFGSGSWIDPIDLPAEYSTAGENVQKNDNAEENDERLGSRVMKKAVFIREHLEDLEDLIYSASLVDRESAYFRQCVDAACSITGLKVDMDGPRPWRRPQGMAIDDDPFSYSPELHASVDAAFDKVQNEKVSETVSTEGIPTFDLHLGTRDENFTCFEMYVLPDCEFVWLFK
ncbi:uncharacterized protein LOC131018895 [Salvia miltiorrhiza]|uniref:uncharacterized protein LOC131018895 n=1 Tax=Salvia miltiorrhiza TaxID=226208 RepID=UPI0025AC8768|nr:uncharacterized protein LOC131018895 [Salvia miltiorrhiza]